MSKRIAILGAMPPEIELIKAKMLNIVERNTVFGTVYEGELFGREVCLLKAGVGKVLTAAASQMLCQSYEVSLLIFTGVGGSLTADCKIGQVCVGTRSIQYDLDATGAGMGFKVGQVPFTDFRIFKGDPISIEKLKGKFVDGKPIHFGMIGTGDTFVSLDSVRSKIRGELGCDVVDMETAAAAQVAALHSIPFISIRSISDSADKDAAESFSEMMPKLAAVNFAVIEMLLGD